MAVSISSFFQPSFCKIDTISSGSHKISFRRFIASSKCVFLIALFICSSEYPCFFIKLYRSLSSIPDIPGYRVGIKTVERDKFPIIFKDNSYPQIICIKSTKYNNLIFVCGLATSNVLNNYQDDDLILDPNLRARGTKTGFYGFEQLVPIKSLNDLSTYKK